MSAGYMAKCATKVRHPSKEAAAAVRRALVARKGDWSMHNSNIYPCNQCGFWHVGRTGRSNRGTRR